MALSTHECTCGATLRYDQDMVTERGGVSPTYKCRQCGTPVPGVVAEKIRHQDPS